MSNQRHHFPSNTCTRKVMRDAYTETIDLYEKIFGDKPNSRIWPKAGDTCGDSYSGLVDQETAHMLSQQNNINH
ncbi:MAG: hypothetical protein JNK00_01675 [Flavipsychrobacter sp.]|nr:hypothetical protein [Flavipsychrobacter sp.]